MKILATATILISTCFVAPSALADSYSCAKMVFKDGWLKQYEYKGNTWGANTKKHGAVSSTVGSSAESVTSSVDPGVMTGNIMSTMQFSSSWGECSMVDYYITKEFREQYIEQNMNEVKKQIAKGDGHHIRSLAFLSGCTNLEYDHWVQQLRANMTHFYDAKKAKDFGTHLDNMIQKNNSLSKNCQIPKLG